MLLTITTTHQPATDLGFLLHKHPDKFQSVELSMGKAHIFYPNSSEEKSTIALLLDIDSVGMVRKNRKLHRRSFTLGQYVSDRPYVASSFMSTAIAKAFSTALNGTCNAKPELVNTEMPLKVKIAVLPASSGGERLIRNLFEPLGYQIKCDRHILDDKFTNWGYSKYFTVELTNTVTVKKLLSHLYVLIPVLDNDKHYYVNEDEINKLLRKGEDWLVNHPQKKEITKRYLINLKSLSRQALEKLSDKVAEEESENQTTPQQQERKATLNQQRLSMVVEEVKKCGAKTVIDLGCGEGKLLRRLLKEKQLNKIVGMDVSYNNLAIAKDRLHFDKMSPREKERIDLFQGSLTYKDKRLRGYDVATIVEVIEHLDCGRLESFERVVFEFAQPKTVILTTPNREYNQMYENLQSGKMRHTDHRFEWTRKEFEQWATVVAKRHNYQVEFYAIGDFQEELGSPTQMGVFNKI